MVQVIGGFSWHGEDPGFLKKIEEHCVYWENKYKDSKRKKVSTPRHSGPTLVSAR